MGVRAKFVVNSITKFKDGGNVSLSAVTSGSEENEKFWKYTPSGSMEMQVINKEALSRFEPGAEYYIDFTKVPESK